MKQREKARTPEDITRLFVERANQKDAEGVAVLYEEGAVMAYPPGRMTVGRAEIQKFWEQSLPAMPVLKHEEPLPTLISGDIALTATQPQDNVGARAQVVRRQPDGSWLRIPDRPEFR